MLVLCIVKIFTKYSIIAVYILLPLKKLSCSSPNSLLTPFCSLLVQTCKISFCHILLMKILFISFVKLDYFPIIPKDFKISILDSLEPIHVLYIGTTYMLFLYMFRKDCCTSVSSISNSIFHSFMLFLYPNNCACLVCHITLLYIPPITRTFIFVLIQVFLLIFDFYIPITINLCTV